MKSPIRCDWVVMIVSPFVYARVSETEEQSDLVLSQRLYPHVRIMGEATRGVAQILMLESRFKCESHKLRSGKPLTRQTFVRVRGELQNSGSGTQSRFRFSLLSPNQG